MTINKIYKTITFTIITSLNLATASSSVKAATLTLTSQSGEIQINSDLIINELGSDVLSVSGNNPGVLTVNNSNLTAGSIIPTDSSGNIIPTGSTIPTDSSGSISPAGGSISISTVSISTGILKVTTTSAQAIPEPTSLTSFAILGLGGLLLRLKKNNQKKRG